MSYISKEEAVKAVNDIMSDSAITHKFRSLRLRINKIPTADVAEVKHGEWNKNNTECSCCKMMNPTIRLDEWDLEYRGLPLDYCPNCGAKMDGGKKG